MAGPDNQCFRDTLAGNLQDGPGHADTTAENGAAGAACGSPPPPTDRAFHAPMRLSRSKEIFPNRRSAGGYPRRGTDVGLTRGRRA